ncbi:hypothetical protein [Saccharothrix sp.]|uniref:hypothetical protein n=1 Tax=Saccharothrix sp. TaxID=1873460 RepID=UPI002811525D|nr:hypothetical protein [Saccharothrix sp.]
MQEPALVWTEVTGPHARPGYTVIAVNDAAGDALGLRTAGFTGAMLGDLLPADLVAALTRLCAEAAESGEPVYRAAAAPDVLTDLSRTATIAVRLTRVGEVYVCTWLPGWLAGTRAPAHGDAGSVADRLALAAAVDGLADDGVGVYSLDLLTGRFVGSAGLHRLFGVEPGADTPADPLARLESVLSTVEEWRDLLRRGTPMDVQVGIASSFGDRKARIVGHVQRGADGLPVVVHGGICVFD